jgi:hypothetical protein
MPKSPILEVVGRCGHLLQTKTWNAGTSVKCTKHEGASIRNSKTKNIDLGRHVQDFCKICYRDKEINAMQEATDENQKRVTEKIDGSKWMCKGPNCARDCDSHPCLINDWLLKQKEEADAQLESLLKDQEAEQARLRGEGEAIAESEARDREERAREEDQKQEQESTGPEGDDENG